MPPSSANAPASSTSSLVTARSRWLRRGKLRKEPAGRAVMPKGSCSESRRGSSEMARGWRLVTAVLLRSMDSSLGAPLSARGPTSRRPTGTTRRDRLAMPSSMLAGSSCTSVPERSRELTRLHWASAPSWTTSSRAGRTSEISPLAPKHSAGGSSVTLVAERSSTARASVPASAPGSMASTLLPSLSDDNAGVPSSERFCSRATCVSRKSNSVSDSAPDSAEALIRRSPDGSSKDERFAAPAIAPVPSSTRPADARRSMVFSDEPLKLPGATDVSSAGSATAWSDLAPDKSSGRRRSTRHRHKSTTRSVDDPPTAPASTEGAEGQSCSVSSCSPATWSAMAVSTPGADPFPSDTRTLVARTPASEDRSGAVLAGPASARITSSSTWAVPRATLPIPAWSKCSEDVACQPASDPSGHRGRVAGAPGLSARSKDTGPLVTSCTAITVGLPACFGGQAASEAPSPTRTTAGAPPATATTARWTAPLPSHPAWHSIRSNKCSDPPASTTASSPAPDDSAAVRFRHRPRPAQPTGSLGQVASEGSTSTTSLHPLATGSAASPSAEVALPQHASLPCRIPHISSACAAMSVHPVRLASSGGRVAAGPSPQHTRLVSFAIAHAASSTSASALNEPVVGTAAWTLADMPTHEIGPVSRMAHLPLPRTRTWAHPVFGDGMLAELVPYPDASEKMQFRDLSAAAIEQRWLPCACTAKDTERIRAPRPTASSATSKRRSAFRATHSPDTMAASITTWPISLVGTSSETLSVPSCRRIISTPDAYPQTLATCDTNEYFDRCVVAADESQVHRFPF
mmetsp:Transcript_2265/g.8745  ORF Transcript_2265/g.8745 Transcript_2265/m.8745 type:complete len:803 (-) Transcript_2265:1243-3651(-)